MRVSQVPEEGFDIHMIRILNAELRHQQIDKMTFLLPSSDMIGFNSSFAFIKLCSGKRGRIDKRPIGSGEFPWFWVG